VRPLKPEEIDLVAAGNGSSSIVVTGQRLPPPIGPTGGGGEGGGAGGTNELTFGSPTSTDVAGGSPNIFDVLMKFVDIYKDAVELAAENESKVAQTFDPANIVADRWFTAPDGNVYQGWAMEDGSLFVDATGNGIADMHFKTDSGGDLWENTGSGWFEVGSNG
jgi:hypothetical protein